MDVEGRKDEEVIGGKRCGRAGVYYSACGSGLGGSIWRLVTRTLLSAFAG